jgi:lysine biosynthesis protein LysW
MSTPSTLTVPCPDCGQEIEFDEPPEQGETVSCPNCWAYLVVSSLTPLRLSWNEEPGDDEAGATTGRRPGVAQ